MSWLAYQLTDSALFLGVVAFFSSISFLLFGTFAGVFADRVPRQKALLFTQGMMLLLLQDALLAPRSPAVSRWQRFLAAVAEGAGGTATRVRAVGNGAGGRLVSRAPT